MAVIAKKNPENRAVEVNRLQLVQTLKKNREKHIKDYEEAMAGYKASLLRHLDKAFEKAKVQLQSRYNEAKEKIDKFTDEDIQKQSEYFTLIDDVTLEMKVPRCYKDVYDSAIDMAEWDVRETLELSCEEFTCFVRDKWDWTRSFETVSTMYKKAFL